VNSTIATDDGFIQADQPAYQALAGELRRAILSGEFPPDRRLPTEAQLAAERGVSRQTVRQAFSQLVAESLVYRVRGRGSFATPFSRNGAYLRSFGSVDELLALSLDTVMEVTRPLERRTDVVAAGRLQLSSDQVMVASFRRLHEDEPFCATTTYLPVEIGRQIATAEFLAVVGARTPNTIIGLIETKASTPIAGAHQSITAVGAPPEIAPLIDCEPGEPVLRIDRLYFDRNGARVELAVNHCNPVRYSYRLEMRRSLR
jgi:GntR family transcriptional regulator